MAEYQPGQQWQCAAGHGEQKWVDIFGEPVWNWNGYEYRRKPEPRLRKWKPQDVPFGARFVHISETNSYLSIPIHISPDGVLFRFPEFKATNVMVSSDVLVSFEDLKNQYQYTLDGKTLLPCGIPEEPGSFL